MISSISAVGLLRKGIQTLEKKGAAVWSVMMSSFDMM